MNAPIISLSGSLLLAGALVLQAQPAPAPAGGLAATNALKSAPATSTGSAGIPAGRATNALQSAPAASTTNCLGPRIQFATKEPNFGRVSRGETVKYTYFFTNSGDQVLHVLAVQPGCGCTRAGDWTKVVEPGQTGSIPIQLATINYQGDVTKYISVLSDDKSLPNGMVQLQLKGNIWTPVEVNPQYLNFTVPYGAASASGTATITNQLAEPVYLSAPQSSNPGFTGQLKTNVPGKSYQLTISRVPPLTYGQSQAILTLQTSLTNQPTVTATVWANVQPPVAVFPSQLTVGPAPLSNPAPYIIIIQNATTNRLVLSDPQVNAKDVKVDLKEVQPGRYFNALLTFPPGFEMSQGQHLEFTVKSSLTDSPVLTVPISQQPKPVVVAPATAPRAAVTPPASQVKVQ
jgi:hypothetical protein